MHLDSWEDSDAQRTRTPSSREWLFEISLISGHSPSSSFFPAAFRLPPLQSRRFQPTSKQPAAIRTGRHCLNCHPGDSRVGPASIRRFPGGQLHSQLQGPRDLRLDFACDDCRQRATIVRATPFDNRRGELRFRRGRRGLSRRVVAVTYIPGSDGGPDNRLVSHLVKMAWRILALSRRFRAARTESI